MFNIFSRKGQKVSLHVTHWEDIDATSEVIFNRKSGDEMLPFYANNMSDESIDTFGRDDSLKLKKVRLRPGWNEYLLTEIIVPIGKVVQWGE